MKYIDLETYTNFSCSGGDCPFTCCGGWGIVIDDATAEYYKTVRGKLGTRLKRNINRENGRSTFALDENGNCTFLNEHGLCDIVLELGEERLSTTCHYFPRFTFFYGNMRFAGVSLACPEVSKFFLQHETSLKVSLSEDELILSDRDKYDAKIVDSALTLLESSLNLIRNRTLSIRERLAALLIMTYQYQTYYDEGKDGGVLIEVFGNNDNLMGIARQALENGRDYASKIDFCSEVMGYYKQIEDFEGHLPELSRSVEYFSESDNSEVSKNVWINVHDWLDSDPEMIWQEHVLMYVVFRYLMDAVSNGDYYGQTVMGIVCVYELIIAELTLTYIESGIEPNSESKMMIMSRASRLVEHDGNFRKLAQQNFKEKGMTSLPFLLKLIS